MLLRNPWNNQCSLATWDSGSGTVASVRISQRVVEWAKCSLHCWDSCLGSDPAPEKYGGTKQKRMWNDMFELKFLPQQCFCVGKCKKSHGDCMNTEYLNVLYKSHNAARIVRLRNLPQTFLDSPPTPNQHRPVTTRSTFAVSHSVPKDHHASPALPGGIEKGQSRS